MDFIKPIIESIVSFTLNPLIIGGVVCLVLINIVVKKLSTLWVNSQPNEWLLVIENGKLQKSGIGLKCIVWPHQTSVTFRSSIERVSFSARNVTKEMQGLEVQGFAIWSVNREGDGPFKCYKYTQGSNANQNVQIMCESIIRHQIANHSLQDVLTNRNTLRDSMKVDLQKQLTGWGIWLETIEITEVKICSQTLFEDLQAEFRQDAKLKAEQIRLETYNKIETNKLTSDLALTKSKNDSQTQKLKHEGEEQIKRKVQESSIYKQQCDLEIEKIKKEQELQLQKVQKDFVIQNEGKKNEREQQKAQKEFELEMFLKENDANKKMDPTALQKYIVDSTERIYNRLPLKEINVNSYIGPDNANNISSFLPALGMMMNQNAQALQKNK